MKPKNTDNPLPSLRDATIELYGKLIDLSDKLTPMQAALIGLDETSGASDVAKLAHILHRVFLDQIVEIREQLSELAEKIELIGLSYHGIPIERRDGRIVAPPEAILC